VVEPSLARMLRVSRSAAPYHHGNLASELERAGLELVEQGGHAGLSLREVARRAGVSHNAPYHHFGDRATLLKRLAELSMAALLDAQRAALRPDAAPIDNGIAMGLAYVHWATRHPGGFALIYDPEVCEPGNATPAMAELIAANEELLAEAVAAMAPDAPPQQVEAMAVAGWGAVQGLSQLASAGHMPLEAVEPGLRVLFAGFASR
jgi:AcrR family transcriptional regulator